MRLASGLSWWFTIDPVALIAGKLPGRQRRLAEAWAELYAKELAADWQRLQAGLPPLPIEPLRQATMLHAIHKVRTVEVLRPYVVRVRFDDDLERTIDLEPILVGAVYGPLRDPELFRQVHVYPEVRTIVWPNGADFDPATLHDWPDHAEAFARKACEWAG